MKTFAAVLLMSLAVTTAAAQTSKSNDDMKDCPLHAQHMKEASSPAQHAHGADSSDLEAMNRRGNEGMGFDQAKTIHHFLIANDGGSINVSAKSTDDGDSITAIRQHFQHIAQAFAAGDFSIPMFVHDQPPPGVAQMQKLKADIQYRYQPTANGARVVISSKRPEAVAAIHQFLDFQIKEHRTGDPASTND